MFKYNLSSIVFEVIRTTSSQFIIIIFFMKRFCTDNCLCCFVFACFCFVKWFQLVTCFCAAKSFHKNKKNMARSCRDDLKYYSTNVYPYRPAYQVFVCLKYMSIVFSLSLFSSSFFFVYIFYYYYYYYYYFLYLFVLYVYRPCSETFKISLRFESSFVLVFQNFLFLYCSIVSPCKFEVQRKKPYGVDVRCLTPHLFLQGLLNLNMIYRQIR